MHLSLKFTDNVRLDMGTTLFLWICLFALKKTREIRFFPPSQKLMKRLS